MEKQYRKLSSLKNWDKNPRSIDKKNFERLKKQITKLGEYKPLLITDDGTVVGGNMRLKAYQELGWEKAWVSVVEADTEEEKIEYALSDNDRVGQYEGDQLADLIGNFPEVEWNDYAVDISPPMLVTELINSVAPEGGHAKLTDKFIIPPFSVFDTRQGYWQDRKRGWLALGIESEIGRGEDLVFQIDKLQKYMKYGSATNITGAPDVPDWGGDYKAMGKMAPGTSVFDPVLCEICYSWFNIKGGTILDPFAGGSVRGIVAEKLGYKYTGIDLSEKQITANREQAEKIGVTPIWISGDSNVRIDQLENQTYDMIFTCPPYEDLEVYSDDPADLSNMEHDDFNEIYKSIIKKAVGRLKDNRFAVCVVGEVRDKKGFYKSFVPNTIRFFEEAGALFYNEAILVNVAGTLPLRVNKQMNSGRKLGKMHQNVLVFYKGDPKMIKELYGELDFSEVTEQTMQS